MNADEGFSLDAEAIFYRTFVAIIALNYLNYYRQKQFIMSAVKIVVVSFKQKQKQNINKNRLKMLQKLSKL